MDSVPFNPWLLKCFPHEMDMQRKIYCKFLYQFSILWTVWQFLLVLYDFIFIFNPFTEAENEWGKKVVLRFQLQRALQWCRGKNSYQVFGVKKSMNSEGKQKKSRQSTWPWRRVRQRVSVQQQHHFSRIIGQSTDTDNAK